MLSRATSAASHQSLHDIIRSPASSPLSLTARRRLPALKPRTEPLRRRWLSTEGSQTASVDGPGVKEGQKKRSAWQTTKSTFKWTGIFCASGVAGVAVLFGAIFVHDAFTYSERHVENVPVTPLALKPKTGGPKNLPILESYLRDAEDDHQCVNGKPRLVVVGGGWGSAALLKTLYSGQYHVTVVSAETFNTFTPLLPSAVVGTVQIRSLVESLRKLVARLHGHFVFGKAVDLVMSEQLLEVEIQDDATKARKNIYVPYDKLVIAVGSVSSTHGVPGLEHCFQLKTVKDAHSMRRRIMDNFEAASLPTTSPEERKRLLSFVVCGGGPTGVETAAEIYDLCQEDVFKYYPKICAQEVSIHIIQSRDHILNTYSEKIMKYAEDKFQRDGMNVIVNSRVGAVHSDRVEYTTKNADGTSTTHEIPSNFVLWSTGIAMNPFVKRVTDLLPNQVHKKAIVVDSHLRVLGAPQGTVYAVGDAATLDTNITSHLLELVEDADRDHDGRISYNEWTIMATQIKKRFPLATGHLSDLRQIFDRYNPREDSDKSEKSLGLNAVTELLQELSGEITTLPATAQVANQQGAYLAKKFNRIERQRPVLEANDMMVSADEAAYKPFAYKHLGALAYIGNAAVFDFGPLSFAGGLAAMYAWRSVYWSEQVSARTRALLMIDWCVRGIWGRDLSKL